MSNYKVVISHLYPDILNLYGDKGNIETLRKRMEWRGIEVEVRECTTENSEIDFAGTDIILLGGGSEHEQESVLERLREYKDDFSSFVERGGTLLALCGGFELLGKTIITKETEKDGLGILDIKTDLTNSKKRLIGNVVLQCDESEEKIVGFENHGGIIDSGSHTPLGRVVKGFGSDGKGRIEGVVYKNVTATYLHGPLLPKNPSLCDRIICATLKNKYNGFVNLPPLDDELELKANKFMAEK